MRSVPIRVAILWTVLLVAVIVGLLLVRPQLDKAHMSLILLLVVLGGSAAGGRTFGLILAALSFLAFNWLLLPPYYSFSLSNPLDWLVLAAFLVTSIVAAQLLYRAREKAQLAHERAESNRLKDALLAAVSHDLRTPLTTIKALAHDLGTFGDERSVIIEQEADRMNRIVTDLLDMSRLNAGALTVHAELNAIDDLLGALAERMETAVSDHRLEIRLAPYEPLLVGRFDLVHSLHILTNLVDNAAKFSPPLSTIEVVATREGTELVIRVLDRGRGIPASEANRIFEPFYRVPETVPDSRGTGLGLSIARRLAEAQGGRLEWSEREGGGSVFSFRLPASEIASLPEWHSNGGRAGT